MKTTIRNSQIRREKAGSRLRIPLLLLLAASAGLAHGEDERLLLSYATAGKLASGGEVEELAYSEKPGDAVFGDKTLADGVLNVTGILGKSKGSQWAGIGIYADVSDKGKPLEIARSATLVLSLASPTTQSLRLRLLGPETEIRNAGCYPVFIQRISPQLTEYRIPVAAFAPESWCGPKARSISQTLSQLAGFEVADITIANRETRFSTSAVRLLP